MKAAQTPARRAKNIENQSDLNPLDSAFQGRIRQIVKAWRALEIVQRVESKPYR
jgi:hypothetical protein